MSSNGTTDAPTMDEERPEPITFTLVIVSPSVGVTGPLAFPHLLASTTVKQLKARIRDALPTKPTDESQRLIHRGRMLARDTETMTEIFGHDTLVNPESQTLHLVLRPSTTDLPSAHGSVQVPTPPTFSQAPTPTPPAFPQIHNQAPFSAYQRGPQNPAVGLPPQQPLPGFQHVQHQAHMHHHQNHLQAVMNARLQHLQQEAERIQQRLVTLEQTAIGQNIPDTENAGLPPPPPLPQFPQLFGTPQMGPRQAGVGLPSFQNLIAQHQRERAAEGLNGASGHTIPSGLPQPSHSGRASPNVHRPDHSTTYTREGVGPNGERWHVTVNETTTTIPTVQPSRQVNSNIYETYPALDIQRTLRNADRAPTLSNSLPQDPISAPVTQDSAATLSNAPELAATPTSSSTTLPAAPTPAVNQAMGLSPLIEPMVYILSSPSGPRALLVNNSETFYTPRQQVSFRGRPEPYTASGALGHADTTVRHRADRAARRAARRQHEHEPEVVVPAVVHQGNPGAGAMAAQIWPHIWLIIRLVGFIWFFTTGNSSWQRFFLICGLAVLVFIANTGLLNGIADQIWGPIRRHVDRLLPLAGPDAALVPAANAVIPQAQPGEVRTQGNGPGTQLDPAEVAARLIEQRRQVNRGWLMTQIRRAEHAMLLFLASLVPGVGERHIAAREAEAVAAEEARQRRIEAENAVEAQAQEEQQNSNNEVTEPGASAEEHGDVQAQGAESVNGAAQPLVEV